MKVDDKEEVIVDEPKIDTLGRSYATGRRKDYCSCLGKTRHGKISINGKEMVNYFARPVLQMQLNFVFDVAERKDQFDVVATVKGGGLSGRAEAVRHGLSRALCLFEPDLRKPLKSAGMLTRDSELLSAKSMVELRLESFQFF